MPLLKLYVLLFSLPYVYIFDVDTVRFDLEHLITLDVVKVVINNFDSEKQ